MLLDFQQKIVDNLSLSEKNSFLIISKGLGLYPILQSYLFSFSPGRLIFLINFNEKEMDLIYSDI